MKKAIALLSLLSATALSAGFAVAQTAAAPVGNAVAGESKAAMCIGCHGIVGYQASFPVVYRVPMIAGQNAKYIAAALAAYQKGERKHPSMRGIAWSLTDTDMADLAAYYESQNKGAARASDTVPAAGADVATLLTKGACAACHGANYSKPIDPSYPKLAGQHADYLYQSLKGYRTGTHALAGRSNAIMGAQVKPYSLAELQAMSRYIASLPGEMDVVPQEKFITRAAAAK